MGFNEALINLRREDVRKRFPAVFAKGEAYYSDKLKVKPPKSTAQLEALIAEFVKLSGQHSQRVKTSGTYRSKKTEVTNVIGRTTVVDTGKYTPSQATLGASDMVIVLYSVAVYIEVKIGKDTQSDKQKDFQQSVERANGYYFIVKTLNGFYELWNELLNSEHIQMNKRYFEKK